ncbi:MAG: Fe-S-containing hydro-lyase [Clostridiales bacterium]|jgi:fumarate hydratase subunit beta|nr:Fe-S-containing hydro-lyase [Clostridiales bacterium]
MEKHINTPLKKEKIKNLKVGDYVFITGIIYSARDAAHKRMYDALSAGEELPFSIENNIVYYMGPSPARPGQIIGSAGPTTASRMDKHTPKLLEMGLSGMIGKGTRGRDVIESMKKNKAVYFVATGGAGALLSKCIKKVKVIAYDELGTEAIHELYVENFPVIVAIDSNGNNLFELQSQIS